MNKIICLFLSLFLIVGCATTPQNPGLTDAKVKKIAQVVELAAYNGTFLFLQEKPENKYIFESVVKSLDILLEDEITLDKFLLIAKELPIKELKSKEGVMIIDNSVILFGIFQDDLIKLDKLEQVQKLKPVIISLRDGIKRGIK
jgi:hypothetical protein